MKLSILLFTFPAGLEIVRTWGDREDTAFVRKGVEWVPNQGRIKIKDAGTYFIYAHVMFHGPTEDISTPRLFQMKILRQNIGIIDQSEQTLFEDLQAVK